LSRPTSSLFTSTPRLSSATEIPQVPERVTLPIGDGAKYGGDSRGLTPPIQLWPSASRRFRAAPIRPTWLKAWGKFPSSSPVAGSISSERRPRSFAYPTRVSNSSRSLYMVAFLIMSTMLFRRRDVR
jgi:hypothetical protein